jgi:hypothetical protein
MKANELRIGNYVNYHSNGILDKVLGTVAVQITCVGVGDKFTLPQLWIKGNGVDASLHDFDSVEPIPLTKELLLKCGFIQDDRTEGYEKNGVTLASNRTVTHDEDGKLYLVNYDESFGNFPISIPTKHIHQLQNLYFALTGEELDVKL